jgi:hypothetical protein
MTLQCLLIDGQRNGWVRRPAAGNRLLAEAVRANAERKRQAPQSQTRQPFHCNSFGLQGRLNNKAPHRAASPSESASYRKREFEPMPQSKCQGIEFLQFVARTRSEINPMRKI